MPAPQNGQTHPNNLLAVIASGNTRRPSCFQGLKQETYVMKWVNEHNDHIYINPFFPNAPFSFPPENIETVRFFGVVKGCTGNKLVNEVLFTRYLLYVP